MMSDKEAVLKKALIALSKKFKSHFANIYFLSLTKAFSINLSFLGSEEIQLVSRFCEKYDLDWYVMQAVKEQSGINIIFNQKG